MNEFWGVAGSLSWAFFAGVLCGILLILFMQNTTTDVEPQPNATAASIAEGCGK